VQYFQRIVVFLGINKSMFERTEVNICQGTMGENSLPGDGPVGFMNRLPGRVGAEEEKPPATRLGHSWWG